MRSSIMRCSASQRWRTATSRWASRRPSFTAAGKSSSGPRARSGKTCRISRQRYTGWSISTTTGARLTWSRRITSAILQPRLSVGRTDQGLARAWASVGVRGDDPELDRYGYHDAGVALYITRSDRPNRALHRRRAAAFAFAVKLQKWLKHFVPQPGSPADRKPHV